MERILPLFVIIPVFSAVSTLLVSRWERRKFPRIWSILTVSSLIVLLYFIWNKGVLVHEMGGWKAPFGIVMIKDSLTRFMLLIINGVALITLLYSYSYILKREDYLRFFSMFLLMLAGMNGVALTGDLFNLFIFLEIASIASYVLVGYDIGAEELEAAFKYLIMGVLASMCILIGIAIVYSVTGSVNMADIARFIEANNIVDNKAILMATGLFILGFGLKAGFVPFHAWLPDAHPSAPAPISAMLSGVLIKSLGIYPLIRIFYNVIPMSPVVSNIFIFLGSLSMIVVALMGSGQIDIKRLFAFHSVSQMGYIIVGVGLGTPLGLIGALFHLLNHSVFKSLLFLSSGAIQSSTGTRNMKELGGLRERMPVTSGSAVVGALSISGVPPFNGFWSKLIIILAAFQAKNMWAAAALVLTAFLTLMCFVKFQRHAIFGKMSDTVKRSKEAPLPMLMSLVIMGLLCLLIGLFNQNIITSIIAPAQEVLLDKGAYIMSVLGMAGGG